MGQKIWLDCDPLGLGLDAPGVDDCTYIVTEATMSDTFVMSGEDITNIIISQSSFTLFEKFPHFPLKINVEA